MALTDAELADLVPTIHDAWCQTPDDRVARNLAYRAVMILPSLVAEVQRLRTLAAALAVGDSPLSSPTHAYFGGGVFDADGVMLAEQAILLTEPQSTGSAS